MSSAIEQEQAFRRVRRGRARICAPRGSGSAGRCRKWPSALRIRLQYLEALEAGRIGELPGNAYALGFLRTYAAALGLDPNEIASRFRAEAAGVDEKTELTFPVPAPERGVPAGAVVLLGVLLAVGAYAGWYRLSGEGRLPAETSTQIPLRLAPLAEQAVRPSAPPVVAAAPAPVAPPPVAAGRGARPSRRSPRALPPPRRSIRRRPPTHRPTSRASCCGPMPMPGCRCVTVPARCC